MSIEQPQRVPENAPGDFYVQKGLCMACCLVHGEAPELMNDSKIEFNECFFRRQPETPDEIEHAINAICVSEADALRYGGTNPEIIRRLEERKCGRCCDHSKIKSFEEGQQLTPRSSKQTWWRRLFRHAR